MYELNFAQVGSNIQRELNLKGMTQQNLADELNISKQVVNKIIKGSNAINVNELSKIAKILGVTTDSLLTVKTKPNDFDSMSLIGQVKDLKTREKIDYIRKAIDEIHMLEDLLDEIIY